MSLNGDMAMSAGKGAARHRTKCYIILLLRRFLLSLQDVRELRERKSEKKIEK